ncbi:50S ribosomal protein L25 [Candidatus Campbellbacteria bacterium]|nr:MAG: 50S ribosomal protein L25 [Candidatus Campbellbacteria bacterium]
MMKLEAKTRNSGQKFDKMKDILAVVYGPEIKENLNLVLNYNDFVKVFEESGYSTIINLVVDGEEHDVLVKEVQIDPKEDVYSHVDFYAIVRGQELEVMVSLEFTGESEAVKQGAVMNTALTEVEIKAMPRDLPSELIVDLSKLKNVGDTIRLEDIELPEGVSFVSEDLEMTIASVSEAVTAEQEEEAQAEGPEFETEQEEEAQEGEEKTEEKTEE